MKEYLLHHPIDLALSKLVAVRNPPHICYRDLSIFS